MAIRRFSLCGQFLAHLVGRAVSGIDQPSEQGVTELVPAELLKMAKAWWRDTERVLAGLECGERDSIFVSRLTPNLLDYITMMQDASPMLKNKLPKSQVEKADTDHVYATA